MSLAVSAVVVASAEEVASADEVASAAQTPTWLSWSPPPECPPAGHIVSRVEGWLGGKLPLGAELSVDTHLEWTGQRWHVSVHVAYDGHSGSREVEVAECSEAADFVAVAVVLAVDPRVAESLSFGGSEPMPGSAEGESESKLEPDDASDPGPQVTDSTARLVPEEAVPGKRRKRRRLEDEARKGASMRVVPHLSLAARAVGGPLPGLRFGPFAAAGFDTGPFSASVGVVWFPPTTTSAEQDDSEVRLSLLSARLCMSYWFLGPRVRVGPQVSLEAGAFRANQQQGVLGPIDEPWFEVGVGAQTEVEISPLLSIFGGAELVVPLTYPRFVLTDGSEVYQVRIGAGVDLGLRFSFPLKEKGKTEGSE